MSFVTYVVSLIKSERVRNMRKINVNNILVKMPREEVTLESCAQMGIMLKCILLNWLSIRGMLAQWWTFISMVMNLWVSIRFREFLEKLYSMYCDSLKTMKQRTP
jgi:hypothetical protein